LISKSFLVSGTFPIRLDKYLIPELPQFSRTRIQALIKEGCILVDGNQVKPGYQLQGNERIQFQIPEEEEGPERVVAEKIPLDILYEDESLIVINKPPRLTVHPGTGKPSGTLVNGLVYYFNELSDINGALRPGIVHRLDEDTSGILVVAKTNPVHRKLAAQFEQRQVEKTYVGVTWGQWEAQEGSMVVRTGEEKSKPLCNQREWRWQAEIQTILPVCGGETQPGEPFLAVAGIARPERFFTAAAWTVPISKELRFVDHHVYTPTDVNRILSHGMPVLTTEKDAVKLIPLWPRQRPLSVLPLLGRGEEGLPDAIIRTMLSHRKP